VLKSTGELAELAGGPFSSRRMITTESCAHYICVLMVLS
jgi:hypothetical protein